MHIHVQGNDSWNSVGANLHSSSQDFLTLNTSINDQPQTAVVVACVHCLVMEF